MNLAFKFAKRYLFSKKSTNAINIISVIATLGIAFGVFALITIMSVFNGLEDLISSLYNNFNPDVKVIPKEGKVFQLSDEQTLDLSSIEGISHVSKSLEEIAFFKFKDREHYGSLKGVDTMFRHISMVDENMIEGEYQLEKEGTPHAILGAGIHYHLDMDINTPFHFLQIFMPRRVVKGMSFNPTDEFKTRSINASGVFATEQEIDSKYILVGLEYAQKMLDYRKGEISAVEIALSEGAEGDRVIESIEQVMGDSFQVLDRKHQQIDFFRLMKQEKWVAYAILSLTLILVAFNMIGSLWMLVLDKKKDIAVLKSMGATSELIKNIFLSEGLLMTLLGAFIGGSLALIFVLLQQQFGLIEFQGEGSFVVDAYPMELRSMDFLVVFLTVIGIGLLSSYLPAKKAGEVSSLIRDL